MNQENRARTPEELAKEAILHFNQDNRMIHSNTEKKLKTSHFKDDRERIEAIEKYFSQGFANSDSIKFLIEKVKELWKLLDEKEREIQSLKTHYKELEEQTAITGKNNLELQRKIEELIEYVCHENTCIRNFFDAGEPTSDGGYRQKFKGKWYQALPIDETPKCDCGLDNLLAKHSAKNSKEKQ